MIESPQPAPQRHGVEVHEQTGRTPSQFQIADDLRHTHRVDALYGLQLDDNTVLNQQVQ